MRFAAVVLMAAVAGCSNVAPTSAPTAMLLTIETAPTLTAPPGGVAACALARLLPIVIKRDGDRLMFVNAQSSQTVAVIWPHGFSARVVNGKGELLDPSGAIIGTEGDTLSELGGGFGAEGQAFGVCSIGNRTYT